jgi:hypothetical protein
LSNNNRYLKAKLLFNKYALTAGTNLLQSQSWKMVTITQALEFDLQMTGNKVLSFLLKALGFSEWYTRRGLSLKSPAALPPRSRVSLSFAGLYP